MFRVIKSAVFIGGCVMLLGCNVLHASAQTASDSPEMDALISTLATGSDEAATAALLQLDAQSKWFLPRYEQVSDAVLNATGSLEKGELTEILDWRYFERTPFDRIFQNRKGDRRELLVFWMAECIRTAEPGSRKEEVLVLFAGLLDRLLAAENLTPEMTCDLLASFRLSIFYPFPVNIVPMKGGNLAIDLYLRNLGSPSEAVSKEAIEGLCRMGFCFPSRREEIRQSLVSAYPERTQHLTKPGASMSLSLPPFDAPMPEEEYFSLREMDALELTEVLRAQKFPLAGNSTEVIVLAILSQRAQKGDESTYEALFSFGEEMSDDFRGLDMITSTLGRGAAKFITDEDKSDAFLQFLATRVQQSAKKSEAIEVAAAVLHESFIVPLPGSPSGAPTIPGTAHAVQALETLAQQSTSPEQKGRIESHVSKIQEKQTKYENEMKKRQQPGKPVNAPAEQEGR